MKLLSVVLFAIVHLFPTIETQTCNASVSKKLPWCLPKNYDKKKPPFLFDDEGQTMNIHYAFSIREVSEVVDKDQTLQVRKLHFYCWPNVYSLLDSNVLHCLLDRGSARSRPGLSPDFITISRHLPFSWSLMLVAAARYVTRFQWILCRTVQYGWVARPGQQMRVQRTQRHSSSCGNPTWKSMACRCLLFLYYAIRSTQGYLLCPSVTATLLPLSARNPVFVEILDSSVVIVGLKDKPRQICPL